MLAKHRIKRQKNKDLENIYNWKELSLNALLQNINILEIGKFWKTGKSG